MLAKMTAVDAAKILKVKESCIHRLLREYNLPFVKTSSHTYFGHETARQLFDFRFTPQVVVFQIVKGGTGKTSIAHEFAVRSYMY